MGAEIVARHQAVQYRPDGYPAQKLVCRVEAPDKARTFSNGRTSRFFPLMVVTSTDITRAECVAVDGFAADTTITTAVNPDMCRLQRALGACPRGLTLGPNESI